MGKVHVAKTQKELDGLLDRKENILIEFGTNTNPAVVHKWEASVGDYYHVKVINDASIKLHDHANASAYDNSHVYARDETVVNAYGKSTVKADGYSEVTANAKQHVEAFDNATVYGTDNSTITLHEKSRAYLHKDTSAIAHEHATVSAYGRSSVLALDTSTVQAGGFTFVSARDSSNVDANDYASVVAYDRTYVRAYGDSNVEAYGQQSVIASNASNVVASEYASVVQSGNSNVSIKGNARLIPPVDTLDDFIRKYAIESTEDTCTLYKAVHQVNGIYYADWNRMPYFIGEVARQNRLNTNRFESCGEGIHLSGLNYALNFGKQWDDIAILELEVKKSDIVVPFGDPGKVRAKEVMVIREVPLEECGIIGKQIIRLRNLTSKDE